MKYIISENKLEKIIFHYLDGKNLIKLNQGKRITSFVYSKTDLDAQIKYDSFDGWCYIGQELITDISNFFSLDSYHSRDYIGKWVQYTLQDEVTRTYPSVMLTNFSR